MENKHGRLLLILFVVFFGGYVVYRALFGW